MKTLLFICGPNGVGKSTTCNLLNRTLHNSAYLDSEWCRAISPLDFTPQNQALIEANMTAILRNYLKARGIEYVIFSYGFHGPRRQMFERVMANIADLKFEFKPFILTCSEEENRRRMQRDGKDPKRIQRSLEVSRDLYQTVEYPVIDGTVLTVQETVLAILRELGM